MGMWIWAEDCNRAWNHKCRPISVNSWGSQWTLNLPDTWGNPTLLRNSMKYFAIHSIRWASLILRGKGDDHLDVNLNWRMQPRPTVRWGFMTGDTRSAEKHSLLFKYVNHGKEAPIEATLNQHVDGLHVASSENESQEGWLFSATHGCLRIRWNILLQFRAWWRG